ncbi:MAG: nucleoside deaminase [Leptospira sp.]|nr:nucleoside deaminase [Leptospira sp.]
MDYLESFLINYKLSKSNLPHEIPSFTEIYSPDRKLIASASNAVESMLNATLHSEVIAIERALKSLNEKYLMGCLLITTLEPCLQCSGAIFRVKIPEVVYFLPAKNGEGISSYSPESIYLLNHYPKLTYIKNSSILTDFKDFFKEKR